MAERFKEQFTDLINILKHKKVIIPIGIILVVVVVALFAGPKISGFTVFSDRLDDCKAELETCDKKTANLTAINAQLETDLAAAQNTIAEKDNEIKKLDELHQWELDDLREQYNNIVNKFNVIVDNSGRNICCKLQFDYPEINSFDIEDNKITCTTDGTFSISC